MKLFLWITLLISLIGHLLFFTFLSELQGSEYGQKVIEIANYFLAGVVIVLVTSLLIGLEFHGIVYMITRVPYGFILWTILNIGLIWTAVLIVVVPEDLIIYITALIYLYMLIIAFIKDSHLHRVYDISFFSNWIFSINYRENPKMSIIRTMIQLGQ